MNVVDAPGTGSVFSEGGLEVSSATAPSESARTAQIKIEVLTLDDFAGIPEIIAVEARPPSVYFTLDRKRWEKKSEEGKLKMLRSVGFILARSAYVGAQFWDDRGRNVGEWFKGGTARVIVPPPPSASGT